MANPMTWAKQAESGSLYVQYDVPTSVLKPAGAEGWAQTPSPQSS